MRVLVVTYRASSKPIYIATNRTNHASKTKISIITHPTFNGFSVKES